MPKPAPPAREDRIASVRSPAPRKKSGSSQPWGMLGALCVLGAVGLAAGPRVSWRASQIALELGEFGIQAGAFAIGGLILMGIGSLRAALDAARAAAMHEEDTLLLEQVARDLIQMRECIDEIQKHGDDLGEQLAGAKEHIATIRDEVTKEPPPPPMPAPDSGLNSDALFRLATSLDKLGARIDERIGMHHASLSGSFEQVQSSLEGLRQALAQGMAQRTHAEGGAQMSSEQPQVCDELATSVPGRSLGLLDALDDECVPAALPARPQDAPADANASSGEIARPGSWDEQLMVAREGGDDTQGKLAQLQALLSDERLRTALENISRLTR